MNNNITLGASPEAAALARVIGPLPAAGHPRPAAMWVASDAVDIGQWLAARDGIRREMEGRAAELGTVAPVTDADGRIVGFVPAADVAHCLRMDNGKVVPRRNTHDGRALAAWMDAINEKVQPLAEALPFTPGQVTVEAHGYADVTSFPLTAAVGAGSDRPVLFVGANPDTHPEGSTIELDETLWARVDDAVLDDLLDLVWPAR